MATSGTPMTELNADFLKENDDVSEVILSKTEMQKKQTLKGIKFSDYKESIEKIPLEGCLGIRITLKNELYGYDIPIPKGQKIYPEKTEVEPEKDKLKVKIFKETKFNLKAGMFR
ncbi:uncharacterized protein LOC125658275 [Ostrea edulis]|uniref:uncharacterized protein LOC125658275 n=1 Tax=Ostrea edulis TaxID=37623 RepID=UPI0024AECDA1|nr:uncharacterized protein LOC125658275 [Ostrea edulis]XP_056005700.1 uncharacterized protein LOC125658275 [Ostrea edulis]XP_056005701.1 uncharacterized protein LOC125658275 [Ostrea edulis]